MIAIIPIEPINEAHGMLIVEAFNKHFINCASRDHGDGCGDGFIDYYGSGWGGGSGQGYGDGDGNGVGNDIVPKEWLIDKSSSRQLGNGHI